MFHFAGAAGLRRWTLAQEQFWPDATVWVTVGVIQGTVVWLPLSPVSGPMQAPGL